MDEKLAAYAPSEFKGIQDVGLGGSPHAIAGVIKIFELKIQGWRGRFVRRKVYASDVGASANGNQASITRCPVEPAQSARAHDCDVARALRLALEVYVVSRSTSG
jgi:hypothetical protein